MIGSEWGCVKFKQGQTFGKKEILIWTLRKKHQPDHQNSKVMEEIWGLIAKEQWIYNGIWKGHLILACSWNPPGSCAQRASEGPDSPWDKSRQRIGLIRCPILETWEALPESHGGLKNKSIHTLRASQLNLFKTYSNLKCQKTGDWKPENGNHWSLISILLHIKQRSSQSNCWPHDFGWIRQTTNPVLGPRGQIPE